MLMINCLYQKSIFIEILRGFILEEQKKPAQKLWKYWDGNEEEIGNGSIQMNTLPVPISASSASSSQFLCNFWRAFSRSSGVNSRCAVPCPKKMMLNINCLYQNSIFTDILRKCTPKGNCANTGTATRRNIQIMNILPIPIFASSVFSIVPVFVKDL